MNTTSAQYTGQQRGGVSAPAYKQERCCSGSRAESLGQLNSIGTQSKYDRKGCPGCSSSALCAVLSVTDHSSD